MDIFRRMETAAVKADVVAYNSAIAACAKGLDWEQAWAVFSSMCWFHCVAGFTAVLSQGGTAC